MESLLARQLASTPTRIAHRSLRQKMIVITISPQFFRCTDLWGTGQFQQYSFECAEGTVFDPTLGVCNWPQVKL